MAIEELKRELTIEVLKRERIALRKRARWYNRRHKDDGVISVRAWNALRQCANLTVAILTLKQLGLA